MIQQAQGMRTRTALMKAASVQISASDYIPLGANKFAFVRSWVSRGLSKAQPNACPRVQRFSRARTLWRFLAVGHEPSAYDLQ
jgi:hypothetical protein